MAENVNYINSEYNILSNKDINENLYLHHATNSIYDEDQGRRFIPSKDVNKTEWANEINGISRNTVNKAEKVLEENGLITILPNGDREITQIKVEDGKTNTKFIPLTKEVAQSMYHILSSNGSKILVYLYNQYQYWNLYMKKPFCFSKSQIAEAIGVTPQTKNLRMIEDNLSLLAVNGIICYSIVKKGNSVYRRLEWMNIKKPLTTAVSDKVESIVVDREISNVDMQRVGNEEQIVMVGYNGDKIKGLLDEKSDNLFLLE